MPRPGGDLVVPVLDDSIAFAVPASDGAATELVTYVYDAAAVCCRASATTSPKMSTASRSPIATPRGEPSPATRAAACRSRPCRRCAGSISVSLCAAAPRPPPPHGRCRCGARRRRTAERGGERGFALLAALLIAGIALVATAALVAAALSSASIAADDDAAVPGRRRRQRSVTDALQRLRWGWLSPAASSLPATFGPLGFGGRVHGDGRAALGRRPPAAHRCVVAGRSPAAAGAAACRIDSVRCLGGSARQTVHVVALSTTADALPRGLVGGGRPAPLFGRRSS